VTGQGLDALQALLFRLPRLRGPSADPMSACASCVRVTDSFEVEDVGLVLGGKVHHGQVFVGQTLKLGPDRCGCFRPVRLDSIHVNRVAAISARMGQTATFAITLLGDDAKDEGWLHNPSKRKGMALVDAAATVAATYEFDAEVFVLKDQKCVGVDHEPIVHVQAVAQSARVTSVDTRYHIAGQPASPHHGMEPGGDGLHSAPALASVGAARVALQPKSENTALRIGHWARVRLRFLYKPEFIVPGDALVLRDSCMRGVGRITACYPAAAVP